MSVYENSLLLRAIVSPTNINQFSSIYRYLHVM